VAKGLRERPPDVGATGGNFKTARPPGESAACLEQTAEAVKNSALRPGLDAGRGLGHWTAVHELLHYTAYPAKSPSTSISMNLDQLPFTAFALEAAGTLAVAEGKTLTLPRSVPAIMRAMAEHEPMSGTAALGTPAAVVGMWRAAVVAADAAVLTITF
jgi:hypothetical protein